MSGLVRRLNRSNHLVLAQLQAAERFGQELFEAVGRGEVAALCLRSI
jgi:hypothetical protein